MILLSEGLKQMLINYASSQDYFEYHDENGRGEEGAWENIDSINDAYGRGYDTGQIHFARDICKELKIEY